MGSITGWVTFVFLFIFSCFCMTPSHCRDTLKQGESIRDRPRDGTWVGESQSLVSANRNFELGFFSPDSSNKRYVGIWYKKGPQPTRVWVANRETPLSDHSGSLTITTDGNLMILGVSPDAKNQPKLEIRILLSSVVPAEINSSLTLSDSGNLVLTKGNADDDQDNVLWQSFDYPSDTYLPGMKLRRPMKLTSWRRKDDPSPGDFTLGLDSSLIGQFSIWKQRGVIIHWTSGFWNGQIFSYIPEMRLHNFSYESDENGNYFRYSVKDNSVISRLVIDVSGQVQLFTWSDETQAWSTLWTQPTGVCDFYAHCGPDSACNEYSSSCKCLNGFEPRSHREWDSNVWSAGCVRRTPLRCGDRDRFMPMKMVRLPAPLRTLSDSSLQLKECKATCRRDCLCTAYASANENGTGCHFWHKALMGLQENNSSGLDFYVRLADFELNEGSKRRLWIIAPVIVPSTLLVFGGIIYYFRRRVLIWCRTELRRKAKRETSRAASLFDLGINTATNNKSLQGGKNSLDFQVFTFATISAATGNFAFANKLGEGGFGPVYKGRLNKGTEIAVKRLSQRSGQGLEEFRTEIMLIAKLQHMNLVQLLGCCFEGEEKILIYEYMPNKSLDTFIFDPVKRKLLDWGKRIQIINGISQGLLYLHKYSRLRIIHRDLKATNILLDSEMNPKISDFGMARVFGQNESEANTKRIVGTYGYMSPEYAMGGLFSEKSDVYSFGVLLLEIVSGKKNTSFYHFSDSLNLLGYAWELWKNGRGSELIDPMLRDSSAIWEITRCIHMGLLCVQESAKDRPNMSNVAALLSNETTPLPTPKRPAFSLGKNLSMTTPGSCSVNLMTISDMEAR